MNVLKTPSERFDFIADFPYEPHYVDFDGMQMHYIDEGSGEIILALHGEPSWSYLYRKFIPELKDHRFIAPDLIGFGKSDKIVGAKNYTFDLHLRSLENLIDALELNNITLVVQDWGGLLGLSLLGKHPERFKRVVIMNTFLPIGNKLSPFFKAWQWFAKYHPSMPIGFIIKLGTFNKPNKEVIRAYQAPFPTRQYKDGARAFPGLIPSNPNAPGAKEMTRAREVLSAWNKPVMILFSDRDRVLGGLEKFFYKLMPQCSEQNRVIIKDAGHFLQEEKGEEIAKHIRRFMQQDL